MGVEPKEQDMPVDFQDLPYEVQQAFHIYSLLPARIAEFSGVYLGKDYGNLGFLFDMMDIEKCWHQFYFHVLLSIDAASIDINDKKRKAKEAASKKPGTVKHGNK